MLQQASPGGLPPSTSIDTARPQMFAKNFVKFLANSGRRRGSTLAPHPGVGKGLSDVSHQSLPIAKEFQVEPSWKPPDCWPRGVRSHRRDYSPPVPDTKTSPTPRRRDSWRSRSPAWPCKRRPPPKSCRRKVHVGAHRLPRGRSAWRSIPPWLADGARTSNGWRRTLLISGWKASPR